MPSSKLIAIITALTCLAGARGVYASYTVDQLADIEQLIVSRDCGGLRAYIGRFPELLEGQDALSEELRSFASGIDTGLIECLSYRSGPSGRDVPEVAPGAEPNPIAEATAAFGTAVY
jgi:hypothetical protein